MYYKITLTASGGIPKSQCVELAKYFSVCEHAYVVNEFGESGGNSHLEIIAEFSTETTSNVTERMRVLYVRLKIPFVRGVSVRVKKATHLIGALIYASKELKESGVVLLLNGWESSWIDKQCRENIKSIPFKMLSKQGVRLTQNTAGARMYEFAKSINRRVVDMQSYREVAVLMAENQYLWGSVRHVSILQDVTALFKSGESVGMAIDSAFRFLGEQPCKQCGGFR